ncbi:type I glyceraldehyde-3-phosphate dehydrogenase [Candidatus Wolfebacteria bacterium]|nr:MAG: type I glyceraldehyde-3-phosphate dehydrogenase [Candidatus Wolfebacteria bacterium]
MNRESIRVAINGSGRIGRAFIRLVHDNENIEIVAINDLVPIDTIEYLLRYDTVYGRSQFDVFSDGEKLFVGGKEIKYLSEPDPEKLPWGELDIDIVIEATGRFTSYEKSSAHLRAGAKRVVLSAPVKDEAPEGIVGATVLVGVNEEQLATCDISSNASCTTNAGSPLVAILGEAIGIEKALLNTIHGYTATQSVVDGPSKKNKRMGRAAAQNIIPTSTGAAIATTKAHTELEGLFDGIAMRVPVPNGSIVDITFIASRDTTVAEVNGLLESAAGEDRWAGIFAATHEELVSSDILGAPYAAIADLSLTRVVGGNLVKVLAWYDNEIGYAHTLVRHVLTSGAHI